MQIPQSLREGVISWNADGQDWADSLPALVAHSRERWQLDVGRPFEGGYAAWVAPAEGLDGTSYVLKVPYPDSESRHEADALRVWDGDGVVRMLDSDEVTRALLLERIRPGTTLLDLADPEEALAVACGLLPRLWIAPPSGHPFVTAQACAAGWAVDIERMYGAHGRPFDAALLRAAVAAFEQLGSYDGESVLLHQDFHRGNVLRAQREPWLVIDPKPLVGERAFDARWLLYDLLHSEPRHALPAAALLDRLSAALALDAERVRLWSFARAVENVLWCYESGEAADEDLALATALL
ncbi:MAG: streptomycin 6-kinase [Gaiellales bacterium]|nr:streptomycin 6-kinase [Gaiellales bacterium]